jgi:sugar lactone lactonase YvrE
VIFNASHSRLAAPLANGSIALVDCADAEPPESRMATDQAGRRTIAPRRSTPRPATIVPASGPGPAEVVCGPDDGFLIAWRDASLTRLDPAGATAPLEQPSPLPLVALCRRGATTLVATEGELTLRPDNEPPARATAPSGARVAALSPDATTIAFGSADRIEFALASAPSAIVRRDTAPSSVDRIVWRDDGAFVAAACGGAGLALIDMRNDRFGVIGNFPSPPRSIAFSGPANALVASGAYRIAAWDLDRAPFDGDRSGALETGRAGMAAVVEVAAHPKRRLVAAAYANGQIVLAEPGQRDEMLLRASGSTPTALAWSADGRMLAIAAEDAVSVASFPDALFKSTQG